MIVQKTLFGEDKHVEFKASIPNKHEKFLKDIIAFANSSGGKTIVGVEDSTGEVIGLGDQNPFRLSDAISNMISDSVVPQINMEITPKTIDGKTVLEVEVFPGRYRPYYLASVGKEKSTYIRVNGTSRPADERKLKELELEGQKISYDTMREIGADYDEEAVRNLMQSMYQAAMDACRSDSERADVHPLTIQKLEDFGILSKEGRDYMPTHAFTLLTNPIDRNIKIQCALFKGTERDEFIDKKEFRGPIQQQVKEAYQFVLRHINCAAVIEGLHRHELYELPTQSIREIIANACLHRSYLDSSAIQVSVYDDRMEVVSPGMLYDGLNVADALAGKSKCRNTAIAEAFQYMKIIEGWGTGLPRLFRQCREMGLPEPKFEEMGDGVKVTVYRANADKQNDTDGTNSGTDGTNSGTDGTNTDTDGTDASIVDINRKMIALLEADSKITQKQLAEKLGISPRTVKRMMSEMRKVGSIERIGSNVAGYWKVNR